MNPQDNDLRMKTPTCSRRFPDQRLHMGVLRDEDSTNLVSKLSAT